MGQSTTLPWSSPALVKTAYLALGSNLGDRLKNLSAAIGQLLSGDDVTVKRASSVYETGPIGVVNQPDFLNAVIEVQTSLSPEKLIVRCLEIETALGRVRHERWGPRVIDLDLLWYDDRNVATVDLSIPHPRMIERAFVLVPLAELAPQLVLLGETVASRAASLGPARIRKLDLAEAETLRRELPL